MIVPSSVEANLRNTHFQFPVREARLLDEGMKTGNLPQIEEQLQSLFEMLRHLQIVLCAFSLISSSLQEINAHSAGSMKVTVDLKQGLSGKYITSYIT
ncbi:MAG: hypothetical protein K0R57_704 [Paenibacillaceae bacterium]|nr:hypothetical protein [Paenibacillaceae bacterium]